MVEHYLDTVGVRGSKPLPRTSLLLTCILMSDSSSIFNQAINNSIQTLESLVNLVAQVAKAADLIEQCLRAGNKLLVCGNGGSGAEAAHFATELVVRFGKDRRAYPAICLTGDGALLTAAGNDYGFDEIFARQVAALVCQAICSFA